MPKQALFEVSCEKRCEKLEAAFRMVWLYSHEISDHITVIMGNTELIHDSLGTHSSGRKYVDEVARCARRIGVAASNISSLKEHVIQRE